ncbi:MAG TPA: hypothetical protein VJA46_00135 [Acidimicrobiia bacterium]|nr:hypothetical protein [Acidimicrobiia bacterium]
MAKPQLSAAVVVGLVATLFASLIALRVWSEFDRDPTVFIAFGEESISINEYAESKLGREVLKRPALGHDGKYFFVQANDPFVLEPEENIAVIDRPLYRSQRMFYPVLAGGSGLFSADVIVWSLLIVNLIAIGVGSWAVAHLAMEMGGSPWWGLAFVLNIGFISEMNIDGAGVVAAAAAFGAVVMLLKQRLGWAITLLTIAVLSREAMLIAAAGSAFWLWRRGERRDALLVSGIPFAAVGLWAIYLRFRIEFDSGVSEVQEIGLPFAGFIDAFRLWADDPLNLVAGITIMLLLLLFTRRVLISGQLVGWAFLGFVPLAILFTRQVWQGYFDITRAVAPVLTAFVLLVFVAGRNSQRTSVRP